MNKIRILYFVVFVLCVTPVLAAVFSVDGGIESKTGGFKFPDGSVQLTAAAAPPVVSPAVSVGQLTLDGLPSLAVYDLEFIVENPSAPPGSGGGGGSANPVLGNLSVTVEAGEHTVDLWLALLSGTVFSGVELEHDDIAFKFTGVILTTHEQVSPRNGVNKTQLTKLTFVAESFQVDVAAGVSVHWDFLRNTSNAMGCNQDDRTYVVTNGNGLPALPTITIPVESYTIGVESYVGGGGGGGVVSRFNPLKLVLVDQHSEATCLLQYTFSQGPGPGPVIVAGNLVDNNGLFSDSHELKGIVANSWRVSVDSSSKLQYNSTINALEMCHSVSDNQGVFHEACWNSETGPS